MLNLLYARRHVPMYCSPAPRPRLRVSEWYFERFAMAAEEAAGEPQPAQSILETRYGYPTTEPVDPLDLASVSPADQSQINYACALNRYGHRRRMTLNTCGTLEQHKSASTPHVLHCLVLKDIDQQVQSHQQKWHQTAIT